MMDIIIEKFNSNHIYSVAAIEKECFSQPWSEESLITELGNDFARFFVAKINGDIVGYIGAHNILGEVYITNVAVLSKYRNKGIATGLINHLLKRVKEENADFVTLEVRKSNNKAIALYEKTGFSLVGKRIGFYENPKEDAFLMTYYIKRMDENL